MHINELIKLVFAIIVSLVGAVMFVSNVTDVPAWLTILALVCIATSGCLYLKGLLSPSSKS